MVHVEWQWGLKRDGAARQTKASLWRTCILPEFFNIILRERGVTLSREFFISVYKFLVISSFVFGPAVRETSFCLFQRQQRSYWLARSNRWEGHGTHSSALAWKIPWPEEPGGLQSMGSLRVGHDWATSLSLFTFLHWRRKWHPTPVFLPGESQGRGSLVGCHLWGHTESDTAEAT